MIYNHFRYFHWLMVWFVLSGCAQRHPMTNDEIITQAQQNGIVISKALAQYYTDYGRYPDVLEALKPTYLESDIMLSLQDAEGYWYQPNPTFQSYNLTFELGLIDCDIGSERGIIRTEWVCRDRTGMDM